MGDVKTENIQVKPSPKVVRGKDFVMADAAWSSGSKDTGVEMRTGASNEEAIRRLNDLKEKFAKMSPEEKREEQQRKEVEDAAHWFRSILKRKTEYSETLPINSDGKLNLDRDMKSDSSIPPLISIYEVHNPADLYKFMQQVHESNPDLTIQFETDPNGQWIKYKVTNKPQE